jgi:hypothetical protein
MWNWYEQINKVLDMMVQHTLIDCSPKPSDLQKSEKTKSKTWCLGNSLLTISVNENVYETRIRRPAGLTVFESKLLNETSRLSIFQKNENVMKSLFPTENCIDLLTR